MVDFLLLVIQYYAMNPTQVINISFSIEYYAHEAASSRPPEVND